MQSSNSAIVFKHHSLVLMSFNIMFPNPMYSYYTTYVVLIPTINKA